ncbi:hypothetical protein EWZ68_03720 [Helicobacter pylori]|nr:hypothetical protein [Helicobacter pylori]NHA47805.1 hypothetical protein [Helicobacter pylori]NHA71071.1 hypothetical protein [Helicobacter pylori]
MQHSKSSFFQKRGRNGIQPSNQATKQRYHVFITIFITFTKDRLKIPYFLLFPLALTLLFPLSLIRATTFLNHLIP